MFAKSITVGLRVRVFSYLLVGMTHSIKTKKKKILNFGKLTCYLVNTTSLLHIPVLDDTFSFVFFFKW